MKKYSVNFFLFLFALGMIIGSCSDSPKETAENASPSKKAADSNAMAENKSENNNSITDKPDLETIISSIREQFQDTEQNLKSYTEKTAKMDIGGGESTADLIGYYDKNDRPRKVVIEEAMGHGASGTSYYMNDGKTYFIFEQRASEASVMGPFTFMEKRIYFNDEKIIRLLEKEKTIKGNGDPKLSEVPNKDITASLKSKSGTVYFDDLDEILKLLAAGKITEKTKGEELSFENTRWKSIDDPKAVIEFKKGMRNNIYDGKNLGGGKYKLEQKSNGSHLTVNENGEKYEYFIIKHTDTELQMSMVGGRGNTLTYEKD